MTLFSAFRPRRLFWQVLLELVEQTLLVLAGKLAGQETFDALVIETFPTRFFVTGIYRKEQALVGAGRFEVPRRIADHQGAVAPYLAALTRISFLLPDSWPQMALRTGQYHVRSIPFPRPRWV